MTTREYKIQAAGAFITLLLFSFTFGLLIGMQEREPVEQVVIPELSSQWIFLQVNETGYNYTWYNANINPQPTRKPTLRNDSWLLVAYFGVLDRGSGNHSSLNVSIRMGNETWNGDRNFTIERVFMRTFSLSHTGGYSVGGMNIYEGSLNTQTVDYFQVWFFGYGYNCLGNDAPIHYTLISSDAVRVTVGPLWNDNIDNTPIVPPMYMDDDEP